MKNNEKVLSMEERNILEIEKVLITENISVDNYLDYFFKINTACSTGIVKTPLRPYLALRNANVILSANDKDNQIEVYDNVVNTVNYLISNYAKTYINENNNLEKYSENLQATMLQNDFITFEIPLYTGKVGYILINKEYLKFYSVCVDSYLPEPKQQFLYFKPEPHGQGSFRPIL